MLFIHFLFCIIHLFTFVVGGPLVIGTILVHAIVAKALG